MVMYIILTLLLAVLVTAIFFEKTLKIQITLNHAHTYKADNKYEQIVKDEIPPNQVLTPEQQEMERQSNDAFTQVIKSIHMFQEVATDEDSSRT